MKITIILSCIKIYLVLFWTSLSSAVRTSKFVATGFVGAMYSSTEVSDAVTENIHSAIECGKVCSNVPSRKCTRFRFCQQETGKAGTCTMYESGNNCIMGENGGSCSYYMVKYIMEENEGCTCAVGYYGNGESCCKKVIIDCTEGHQLPHLKGRKKLLAFVKPVGYLGDPFDVLCKFRQGGLTYISSRVNTGSILNFNRTWIDYVQGFENGEGSFWLGLTKILALLQNGGFNLDLRIVHNNEPCILTQHILSMGQEVNDFVIYLDLFNTGNPPDWCSYFVDNTNFNGMSFSTFDHNNSCPSAMESGWWFNDTCTNFNPNAPYNNDSPPTITGSEGQPQLDMSHLRILRISN